MNCFISIVSKNPKMSVITHLSVRKNNQLRAYQFRFGRFGSSVKSFFSKNLCYFCLCFESKFFWCLNWMNRRWQKRCTQLILGGRPVPVLVAMVNEAPKSFILTFWLIEELFYICIHLNHITSCNPLLNTILIVMDHVISTCRNMMLFSRPVSYTKIPPVYIPTSITACTINHNYYY